MDSNEPLNNYVEVMDISGSIVSILDNYVNFDIYNDFEIVKYVINHTTDNSGNLFYSIDKIDCMTQNWFNENYNSHFITTDADDICVNIGFDTQYLIYNKNELASKLFNTDLAGNIIFFWDEYHSQDEIKENLKSIKNYCMRTNLIDAVNIKI